MLNPKIIKKHQKCMVRKYYKNSWGWVIKIEQSSTAQNVYLHNIVISAIIIKNRQIYFENAKF